MNTVEGKGVKVGIGREIIECVKQNYLNATHTRKREKSYQMPAENGCEANLDLLRYAVALRMPTGSFME
jgi:hypothetical protein